MRVSAFLRDVTRVEADLFAAPFFEDVRPPRGLLGKVDWYLGGFLSRLILEEKLHGKTGEKALVPLRGKLLTPWLMLIGLGTSQDMNVEIIAPQYMRLAEAARDLGCSKIAIEIPLLSKERREAVVEEILLGFEQFLSSRGGEVQILARNEKEGVLLREIVRNINERKPSLSRGN